MPSIANEPFKSPLIDVLERATEALKAERYMSANPYELASALVPLMHEVAFHMQSLNVFKPEAIDQFREHQDVGIPGWVPSSAEVLLTGPLQVFIDSLPDESA